MNLTVPASLSISIHALREESDEVGLGDRHVEAISIHALREESDLMTVGTGQHIGFQSTLSVRRATEQFHHPVEHCGISIHALREESDENSWSPTSRPNNFNPRSP